MTAVIPDGVSGEKSAHEIGKPIFGTPQKDMGMVIQKSPGINDRFSIDCQVAHSFNKCLSVFIVIDNMSALDSSHDDMM